MSNSDRRSQQGTEPGTEPGTQPTAEVQESNPNAGGPQGLSGGMGVSSERTGPFGEEPAVAGVQGTGSHGTATEGTDGVSDTSRAEVADAPGAETDDADHDAGPSRATGIDRTVGEANPAEVPAHENDPLENPGHSHGS